MSGEKLESLHCVKDLGVTITSNLKFSQQCKEAAGKVAGLRKKIISFRNKGIILPLYQNSLESMRCNFGHLT